MHETGARSSTDRLGFMVPMVLFVLLFVICCGVIVCVFLRAASETAEAGIYDDCVQLCRNQAEVLRGTATEPVTDRRLYFDGDYHPTDPENGVYYLVVAEQTESSGAGRIRRNAITAYTLGDEAVYTLDVAVYLPDREADHG